MVRKLVLSLALACTLLLAAGCHHKVQNPLANIDSKQPDKGLYDRAMDSMKHGRYQEARTLLETLLNTYPDSEYLARAKLAVGDSWYNEGGTAAWQQAEVEYKDFQTFYPNLPEASEAQLKVAKIHYRQMEKPDRDYAQAMRAAEEYKSLITTYPDSPLVPEAKQRLREVQELLAERQYRIAHFYFLRDNLAASQARMESLIDSYPLYSQIDEALYELGALYEKEAATMRKQRVSEAAKEKLVAKFQEKAVDAYTRIIKRYPAMGRADSARQRLKALNAPVPTPTAEAMAESKAEEESRGSLTHMESLTSNFKKHPDVTHAPKVGEPSLEEEKVASAPAMVNDLNKQLNGLSGPSTNVGLQPVKGNGNGTAAPGANEPPPNSSTPEKPAEGAPAKAAPAQVNEVQGTSSPANSAPTTQNPQASGQTAAPADAAAATADKKANDNKNDGKDESTSKKKTKKGLRKLIPF
jgi:outer membrane protein assembly factor BamD